MIQDFPVDALHPDESISLNVITSGLLHRTPFLMPENLEVMADSGLTKSALENQA
jgi:hypothetical protein